MTRAAAAVGFVGFVVITRAWIAACVRMLWTQELGFDAALGLLAFSSNV